jgi:XTP/dITP diphosphohydrolase
VMGDREQQRRHQDAANNRLLLQKLEGVGERRARFVSVLVALRSAQDPEPLIAFGRWEGEVLPRLRGEGGFGYDPLLWIPALGHTVAELGADVKNQHSHRAMAARSMRTLMREAWHLG